MCFGSKEREQDSGPGPRPAQTLPQKHSYSQDQVKKTSSYNGNMNSNNPYSGPSGAGPSSGDYAPPAGPPPGHHQQEEYAPPSGPPPGHADGFDGDYAPPPGAPPSHHAGSAGDFAPPPGPPPARQGGAGEDWIVPPLGPPPSQQQQPSSKQHDWEAAVPDTSLFPPPPAFFSGWDRSPANNATEAEAEAGEAWVKQYPMCQPLDLDPAARAALARHDIALMPPAGFKGRLVRVGGPASPGQWELKTDRRSPDSCVIGYPPLYVARMLSPLVTGRPATIYYEVKVRGDSRADETSLALGFAALPYPGFRLPGWHRGSLGVHGDDGHKYINDRWGGQSFTQPFRRGETLGLGMTFSPPEGGQAGASQESIKVEVFFTRNGRLDGKWDLHEEGDADVDLPVTGLEGFHDLSVAIGAFDMVSVDVIFDPARWSYRVQNPGFGS